MKVFCIQDVKAGVFHRPFIFKSVAEATRSFAVTASEGDTAIQRFPHDFRLKQIADFDDETGVLTPIVHVDLGSAADFIPNQAVSSMRTAIQEHNKEQNLRPISQ